MSAPKRNGRKDVPRAVAVLQSALEQYKPGLPHVRMIAERLCSDDQALALWPRLDPDGSLALKVWHACRQAFEHAQKQCRRFPVTEERRALDRVGELAAKLKEAIEAAPLPRNTATFLAKLTQEAKPDALLSVGWQDVSGPNHFGYPLSITQVLDWTKAMLDAHIAALPPRSIERSRTDDPNQLLARAFLHWLSWHLPGEIGPRAVTPTVLAKLTNAVIRPTNPFDKNGARDALRTVPDEFRVED